MTEYGDEKARQLMAKDAKDRGYREREPEIQAANALMDSLVKLSGEYNWLIKKMPDDSIYIWRPNKIGRTDMSRSADAALRYEDGSFFMKKGSEREENQLPLEFDLYTRTFVGPPDENSPTGRRPALACIIDEVIGSRFSLYS